MKFGLVSYFIISDISLNFTNRKGLISMKKFIPLPSQRFNMESENGTVISFGTIIFRNSIFNLGSAYVGVDWEPHKPGTRPHLQGSLRNLEATHPSKPRRFRFRNPRNDGIVPVDPDFGGRLGQGAAHPVVGCLL